MRYVFLIFFLLFAVLPVMAHAALSEPVSLESVDMIEADDLNTEDTLYINVCETYETAFEKPEVHTALIPLLLWRPPMNTA